ncbi:DUF3574 domain-containing protein [Microbulbifer pacificus]|uniref:DUF3574 domain-containing protein n=1 Tax=Microbulbifer pacificus TaxID=407164 RepID=A0AAU0MX53_9GAMM|nr:DUF3574 domain-containing protein [Microbulbifer pacificus]WOX04393.1 DUF3574 domain-containing protein [Microbulbifer pacificus]
MLHFRRRFRRPFPQLIPRPIRHVAVAALCLVLAACATQTVTDSNEPEYLHCRDDERWQVQEHIYFGTHTPQGFVSKAEWAAFVEKVITPKFPHGLTVLAGSGQWQGASGNIVREPSYVLSLIYPYSRDKDLAIAEIIREYKRQFQQQVVLRVRSGACVSFL